MGRWARSSTADEEGKGMTLNSNSASRSSLDSRTTSTQGLRVAVVGSGPAGIFCADRLAELAQTGHANIQGAVQLFRSRSKLSASQMESEHNTIYPRPGAPFFDYGCQYITAGDPWFADKMRAYEKAGICQKWSVGVLSREEGMRGMWVLQEDIVQHIAGKRKEFLKLHHAVENWPPRAGDKWLDSTSGPNANRLMVTKFEKKMDGTWILHNSRGDAFGPFDVLVGAFYSHAHTDQQLTADPTRRMRDYLHRNLQFLPLVVVWVAFERSPNLDFQAAFVAGDERLVWVSNNCAKAGEGIPLEADGRELWTLIASTKYSIESVAKDAKKYKRRAFVDTINAFKRFVDKDLWSYRPTLVRANHWGGAVPCSTLPSDSGCLFDSTQSLGWCGAWATYSGVEGAAVSGKRMAELVASLSLGERPPTQAEYPEGPWMDMGCRATDGRTCLDHGVFHMRHPLIRSLMFLPTLAKEPEGLHRCLNGWDYAGSADTDPTNAQDVHENLDNSKRSRRRWVSSGEDAGLQTGAEKKIDPDGGEVQTFAQLLQKYGGKYSQDEIKAYWNDMCAPASEATGRHADVKKKMRSSQWQAKIEKKVDPNGGQTYTFEEILKKYSGTYSRDAIQGYWHDDCTSMSKAAGG